MIIITCVDEKNGMMFHRRRQTRDRILLEDIIRECGKKDLYMDTYSSTLFPADARIVVREDFLERAAKGTYCFVEDADIRSYAKKTEAVLLYKWNRKYPADVYFPWDMTDGTWKLLRTEEFSGSSHDKITKEVYKKIT